MEIPWRCADCQCENMVDLDALTEWPLDKVLTAQGYVCECCGRREALSFVTVSLREAVDRLTRWRPGQAQFEFHFAKLLKKAQGVNQRGFDRWHGTLERENLAESGPVG